MPEPLVPGRRLIPVGSLFFRAGGSLLLPSILGRAFLAAGEDDRGDRYYRYERQSHEERPQPPYPTAFALALAVFSIGQRATSNFGRFR